MNSTEWLEKIMELVIRPTGNTPIHNCMLFLKDIGFPHQNSRKNLF